ncbi:hypothetical protein D6817_00780 [Candidatus Pacearchaeota archaeon]|nr:MAG: hypothetical protein D6817_00780 [Candidatus Pacearchaeota archaeon]
MGKLRVVDDVLNDKKLCISAAIVVGIFIFYFSSLPGTDVPKTKIPLLSVAYHLIAFLLFTSFILLSLTNPSLNRELIAFGLVFALFYALTDEIHQIFVPFRDASLFDLFVDSVGILIAFSLVFWLRETRRADKP